jgi:outer membrane protein OmpA-like peptidoglycan-associated protein
MRTRTFGTLFLSTVIVLPAFAQQGNSGSGTQPVPSATQTAPASPSVTATGEAPLTWTRGDFWDGDEPGFAAFVLHPFASKGYVHRQTVPIHDRLNELEQIATTHGDKVKDIDGRTQQGVQLASTKTNESDQHALDASNKAQMAQQAAGEVNTHLSKVEPVIANIDQYKADAQTVIRFRPGQTVLSKDAKSALDEMATPLKDQHGYVIEVQGFSSGQGQAAIAASRRMADSVARYLVLNHEVPTYRIYTVGMGNAAVPGEEGTTAKRASGSRVAISVLKNSVDQVVASPSSGAPPK